MMDHDDPAGFVNGLVKRDTPDFTSTSIPMVTTANLANLGKCMKSYQMHLCATGPRNPRSRPAGQTDDQLIRRYFRINS